MLTPNQGMATRLAERAVQRDGAMAEMAHQKNLLESVLETRFAMGAVPDPERVHSAPVIISAILLLVETRLHQIGRVLRGEENPAHLLTPHNVSAGEYADKGDVVLRAWDWSGASRPSPSVPSVNYFFPLATITLPHRVDALTAFTSSSPGPTSTGTDSPVTRAASIADVPRSITPSVATFSPGRTTNRSPKAATGVARASGARPAPSPGTAPVRHARSGRARRGCGSKPDHRHAGCD